MSPWFSLYVISTLFIFQQESNKSEQQLGVVTLDLAKTSKVADGILKKVTQKYKSKQEGFQIRITNHGQDENNKNPGPPCSSKHHERKENNTVARET